MDILKKWFVQVDPTEEDEKYTNYFTSKPAYSSEIYAKTEDGETAQVASIPLVLTDSDHDIIHALDQAKYEAQQEYFKKYKKKHWWESAPNDKDNKEWKELLWAFCDTEHVYKPRKSKEYHDAHLHLVLSTPYMYEILKHYFETGEIDKEKVKNVLDIADGITTPFELQVPKWKLNKSFDEKEND